MNIALEDILILLDNHFTPHNICLVTGAGRGIGRATSVAAAANNLLTIGLDSDAAGGYQTEQFIRKMGGRMIFIEINPARDGDLEDAVQHAAKLGQITYLANTSTLNHAASLGELPLGLFDRMLQSTVRKAYCLSTLVIPHMKKNQDGIGVIGNLTPVHSHICSESTTVMNIVNFGLRALTQSISSEGKGRVRAFSVSPGPLSLDDANSPTPRFSPTGEPALDLKLQKTMLKRCKLKEPLTPIEVANLFVFGFSRFARHLVGGDLLFDGGMVGTY